MKKLLSKTWVGWLNIIVLQWLFVRLFYATNDQDEVVNYGFIFPVLPLTGWWSDYIPAKQYHVDL